MQELGALIAQQNQARAEASRKALDEDANRLCVFCAGKHTDRCSCRSDCGKDECPFSTTRPGDWLTNPRGLAPVPRFRW